MRGKFITLEGSEGSGKSSNIDSISRYLQRHEIESVVTREPGGTGLGEALREVLLNSPKGTIDADAELLLMFAARSQHLQQVITPALQAGRWVLCDRFTDASYAYQGAGRGIELGRIARLEEWVQGGVRPDLTLLLDLPVEQGLQRAGRRGKPDRFEQEQREFFERVRQGYLAQAAAAPERYRIIDSARPLAEVKQQITTVLDEYLAQHGETL